MYHHVTYGVGAIEKLGVAFLKLRNAYFPRTKSKPICVRSMDECPWSVFETME